MIQIAAVVLIGLLTGAQPSTGIELPVNHIPYREEVPEKTTEELVDMVMSGELGVGDERKFMIFFYGGDYDVVQGEVDKIFEEKRKEEEKQRIIEEKRRQRVEKRKKKVVSTPKSPKKETKSVQPTTQPKKQTTKQAPKQKTTSKTYSLRDLQFHGVINWGGYKYTYYSQQVLPGPGLKIPGRHVNAGGFVADKDGYIVLANDAPKGTVFPTPFGYMGKVYDRGTTGNHLDVYTK